MVVVAVVVGGNAGGSGRNKKMGVIGPFGHF